MTLKDWRVLRNVWGNHVHLTAHQNVAKKGKSCATEIILLVKDCVCLTGSRHMSIRPVLSLNTVYVTKFGKNNWRHVNGRYKKILGSLGESYFGLVLFILQYFILNPDFCCHHRSKCFVVPCLKFNVVSCYILVPNVGLEPTTLWLRISYSTNWANRPVISHYNLKRTEDQRNIRVHTTVTNSHST